MFSYPFSTKVPKISVILSLFSWYLQIWLWWKIDFEFVSPRYFFYIDDKKTSHYVKCYCLQTRRGKPKSNFWAQIRGSKNNFRKRRWKQNFHPRLYAFTYKKIYPRSKIAILAGESYRTPALSLHFLTTRPLGLKMQQHINCWRSFVELSRAL